MRGTITTEKSYGRNKQGQMAKEIDAFLTKHHLWEDCCIYVNGKRFTRKEIFDDNFDVKGSELYVEENMDPERYFDYFGDKFLCMSFEGPLYNVMNYYDEDLIPGYDERMRDELSAIFKKYGRYYDLGNAWNLAAYEI